MFDILEDIFDIDENGKWPLYLFLFVVTILFIINILASPLVIVSLSYILFLFIFAILFISTFFLGCILSLKIETTLIGSVGEVFLTVLKIISIIGILFSVYLFVKGIIKTEWSAWGIRGFLQTMSLDPIQNWNEGITLFKHDVFSKFWFMIKALFINIGKHVLNFIWHFFFPWNLISTGIGIIRI